MENLKSTNMNQFVNEALFAAVESSDPVKVEKALIDEKINPATYYGAKSIVFAAKQESSEILKMLLENGEKINREVFWRRTARSALSNAARAENTESVKLLLEYGAGMEISDLMKAIACVAENRHTEILKMLLDSYGKAKWKRFFGDTASIALSSAYRSGNMEAVNLLLEYGAGADKKNLTICKDTDRHTSKTKFCLEDDVFIPEKSSRNNLFIKNAGEGKLKKVEELLEEGVSDKAFLAAVDAALDKNKWEVATFLTEYSDNREVETYTECIKKMFLKSSYIGDTEKVKFYLEKLIENVVGVLTDDTGKTTLEIALENNPADIIKILSNYGFHESSLQHAYRCLLNTKLETKKN